MSDITFNVGEDRLHGNLFLPGSPQPLAFLFIHGWMGHQNTRAAKELADLDYACLTYDMRGNRTSQGDINALTRADFLNDALAAYDFLAAQLEPGAQIGVVGSSFGSYLAILLTEHRRVSRLSLRVSADYPDEGFADQPLISQVGEGSLRAWREQIHSPAGSRALTALHQFDGNIQIVEAEADEQVPHQTLQNYAAAVTDPAKLQYDVMRDAPHSLKTAALSTEYCQLLTSWVTSTEQA